MVDLLCEGVEMRDIISDAREREIAADV